jgi:hypothetical protein
MVVVSGHDDDLAVRAERRSGLCEERSCRCQRLAQRTLTQLQRVAEQHESLDPVTQRLHQRRAQLRAAQQVGSRA